MAHLASTAVSPLRRCASGEIGGYEVHQSTEGGTAGGDTVALLEWMSGPGSRSLPQQGFLLIRLPGLLSAQQLSAVVQHQNMTGLQGRLCLACPQASGPWWGMIEHCHAHGIRLLLDDVGLDTRLGEICQLGFDALRLRPEVVERMSGCPRTAAAVEAAIGLAHDVGMLTLAHHVNDEISREQLVEAGIDYMGQPDHQASLRPRHTQDPANDLLAVASTTEIRYFLP